MSDDIQPTFQGEAQLAGWSETHAGGAKITFWLPDAADLDVFRALTVRKGGTAGQRFMMVLVEIGDDEQPVPPPEGDGKSGPQPGKPVGGMMSKWLAMRCNDPEFWEFLQRAFYTKEPITSAERAAEVVRWVCKVASRAEIDHSAAAMALCNERIRLPFMDWVKGRNR
jgi:hypothetical protein